MKKTLVSLLIACACLLFGCANTPDTPNAQPPSLMINGGSTATSSPATNEGAAFLVELDDLPKTYPPEVAAANGDYVDAHGKISNEDKLTEFLNAVREKKPAAIRMVVYTIEGDPIISDILFDGNTFAVWKDTTRDAFGEQKITKREYARMLEYESGSTAYVFLTNEEAITDELYRDGLDGHLLYYKSAPNMPGGLPDVYPESEEANRTFFHAQLLPDVYWATENNTDMPIAGKMVSIPSGRVAFAFLPTRPHESMSIYLDENKLQQLIGEIAAAEVLQKSSRVDWAKADFDDYRLDLYVLTDGGVYNCVSLSGPIRYQEDTYVDIGVQRIGGMPAFETWRVKSPALGAMLQDIWGPKFDLARFSTVTRIDMRVLTSEGDGNTAVLEGSAAKDIAERMMKTAQIVSGYGKCGYNIELTFTFSDGSTELGWLNGDSCPGIAMDRGPSIMFDKEITRELYQLLDYGEGFISD